MRRASRGYSACLASQRAAQCAAQILLQTAGSQHPAVRWPDVLACGPPVGAETQPGMYTHTLTCFVLPAQENNLVFRSGHYTGRGWEVVEYSQLLQGGVPNYGGQIGWYMVGTSPCESCEACELNSLGRIIQKGSVPNYGSQIGWCMVRLHPLLTEQHEGCGLTLASHHKQRAVARRWSKAAAAAE